MNPSHPPGPTWFEVERAKLSDDIDAVRRYCERHPAEASGVRLDHGPPLRIVAHFVHDLPRHGAALRALTTHPDRVVATRGVSSRAEQDRIIHEIRSLRTGDIRTWSIVGLGPGADGIVTVRVRHGEHAVAAELEAQFGRKIQVIFADASTAF